MDTIHTAKEGEIWTMSWDLTKEPGAVITRKVKIMAPTTLSGYIRIKELEGDDAGVEKSIEYSKVRWAKVVEGGRRRRRSRRTRRTRRHRRRRATHRRR